MMPSGLNSVRARTHAAHPFLSRCITHSRAHRCRTLTSPSQRLYIMAVKTAGGRHGVITLSPFRHAKGTKVRAKARHRAIDRAIADKETRWGQTSAGPERLLDYLSIGRQDFFLGAFVDAVRLFRSDVQTRRIFEGYSSHDGPS